MNYNYKYFKKDMPVAFKAWKFLSEMSKWSQGRDRIAGGGDDSLSNFGLTGVVSS